MARINMNMQKSSCSGVMILYDTQYLGCDGEFWMGEGKDLEKIKFDKSCSIYVPAGVGHFPLFLKNVKSPVMMGVVVPKVGDLKLIYVPR